VTVGGVVVLILGVVTTALTAVAGVASLMTPRAKPAIVVPQHAATSP
jgi:hypothetical protein